MQQGIGTAAAGLGLVLATVLTAGTALANARAPRFSVTVTLSAKAAAELAAKREGIIVAAYYYGEPTKAAEKKADEVGQIGLGTEQQRLGSAGGTATFTGKGYQAKRLGWIAGEPQINVNVYSARLSGPDNLLDCGLFEDAVSVAEANPVTVACKLIGER